MSKNIIFNYKSDKEKIEKAFDSQDIEKIKELLDNFLVKNPFYYIALANYYYIQGDIKKSLSILKDTVGAFPNSFELHYNLALIYSAANFQKDAVLLFARAIKIAGNDTDRESAYEQLNTLVQIMSTDLSIDVKAVVRRAQAIINESDNRWYPLDINGESLVRKPLYSQDGQVYFTNLYRVMDGINDIDNIFRYFTKAELVSGELSNKIVKVLDEPSIIPISFKNAAVHIKVIGPNNEYNFEEGSLAFNRFNYLKFDEVGEYIITASEQVFVGDPWPLKKQKKKKPLIINLFIDGFAYTEIQHQIPTLMPNTYNFFKEGYISERTFTTGEWTYPTMSSMLTGKTTLMHGRYHGTNLYNFTKYNNLFFKDFQQAGYMTTHITGNWRMTPTFGYLEGVNRTLFQNSVGGFHVGEIVSELLEHIEAFKESNQFIWAGIMDLHDVPDEVQDDLLSQSLLHASTRQSRNKAITSVLSKYDENKVNRYKAEIYRLDLYLGQLYQYLQQNFDKDDYIVSIVSDHGQGFLSEEENLLNLQRRNVVFMMAGGDVPNKLDESINSIIDIIPTIAHLAEVPVNPNEGKVIEAVSGEMRDFALTETIHPNQPYRVAITDSDLTYHFETLENLDENCLVDLEKYKTWVTKKGCTDKEEFYTNFVLERALILQK